MLGWGLRSPRQDKAALTQRRVELRFCRFTRSSDVIELMATGSRGAESTKLTFHSGVNSLGKCKPHWHGVEMVAFQTMSLVLLSTALFQCISPAWLSVTQKENN